MVIDVELEHKLESSCDWLDLSCEQHPFYNDNYQLLDVLQRLYSLEPVVSHGEVDELKSKLDKVYLGKAFLLQMGDCAEDFSKTSDDVTLKKMNFMHYVADKLSKKLGKEVFMVGRIAGQFAKPRSKRYQDDNQRVLNYFGDMINQKEDNVSVRNPDPNRMITAYESSKKIYHFLKENNSSIFTSHEGLSLYYESALSRVYEGNYYNLSTHFPWIGIRTFLTSRAHLAYFSKIKNPIGIKIGVATDISRLVAALKYLDRDNEIAKLTLITRFGKDNVSEYLPSIIRLVNSSNLKVLWICDPMHGNTITLSNGVKTRRLSAIIEEIASTNRILSEFGLRLSGLHLEATHEDVMECCDIEEDDTSNLKFASLLDPRLNFEQTNRLVDSINIEVQ